MSTVTLGSVQGSMLTSSNVRVGGITSIVSSVISVILFGRWIFRSFSMFLTIPAFSPCFYSKEVSYRCADCFGSVGIIFFVNQAIQSSNIRLR